MKIMVIDSPKYGRKEVLLDDYDYDRMRLWKWSVTKKKNGFYAIRSEQKNYKQRTFTMHRMILGVKDTSVLVDHRDHNGLNNQRSNIRLCTPTQNQYNRTATGYSKYLGVSYEKIRKKWRACIVDDKGRRTKIARFNTEIEAAKAYNELALKYRGEFANLNKIPEDDQQSG